MITRDHLAIHRLLYRNCRRRHVFGVLSRWHHYHRFTAAGARRVSSRAAGPRR